MELVAERKKPEDAKLLRPLASQKFPYVGGNAVLEAIPQVVHFGGFRLNHTLTQKVRILNKGTASTRMHIVTPTDGPFHVENNRRGTIYPGMSEDLVVTFTAHEFKYFYDCVKVHSEGGNFIIPMHAYPVVNKPLGFASTRTVTIGCSVPIEFEFRIQVKRAHSSITVHPVHGTIPANGEAEITIAFQPIVMANVFCEIELLVSQFDFQPMTCVISGASAPGLQVPSNDQEGDATVDTMLEPHQPANDNPPPSKRPPKKTKKTATSEVDDVDIMDGIKIPKHMDGITATNFVLTQQPGKLKPKDLKRAIDENRALRKRQKAEQEALRLKTGSTGGGRLSFDVLLMEESVSTKPTTRQLKELVFLQELQEIDKMESELEFQSNREFVGDSLLAPRDIDFIYAVRTYHKLERERNAREVLRTTFASHGGSVSSIPPVRAVLPAFHTPTHVPDFNPYKNDLWAKRKRVRTTLPFIIDIFYLHEIDDIIIGHVDAREVCASGVQVDHKKPGETAVAVNHRQNTRCQYSPRFRDWKFAQVSITDTKQKPPLSDSQHSDDNASFMLNSLAASPVVPASDVSSIVVVHSYPLYLESESRARFPVAVATDTASFQDFNLFPLDVPLEANLMGYRPQQPLPIPQYVPLEATRSHRVGAQHEAGVRVPRAIVPVEAIPLVPHAELVWRFTLEPSVFIFPPATLRVYTPLTSPLETDPEYILQPRRRERQVARTTLNVMADTPGTISLAIKTPYMLHTAWVGWRDRSNETTAALWDAPPGAPALIDTSKTIPIDMLSDSESDNEDTSLVKVPTLDDAKRLFEDDMDLALLATFPRYDAWLRLENEYQTYRNDFVSLNELRSHVKGLHKERSKARCLNLKPLDRVNERLTFEKERDLWWHHAESTEGASPGKMHAGFNFKQIEKELRLSEEREWMKKHKKARPHEFTIAEKRILRDWFDLLDTDSSGTVSTDELQEMLLTLGLAFTTDESNQIIRSIDADSSGYVDFEEFVLALTPQHGPAHARLDDLDRSASFTGLKKSMEAQSRGLLDAKTHVSIERRRFLVNAIMETTCSTGVEGTTVDGDDRKRRKRKSKLPVNTKLRLHGLEHAITRNARSRVRTS
ncbi:hypothetical protein B5M09_000902 [Aphanomyces astaci]|uniref:EF-hand domain-containing protein n=1 Tax=Aphanomyces astaci TaxID=112090 RepID=A0A425D7P7_APHAT|nr:hypothetical protein B5M09_000902 [Aphanomyces astaci]